MGWKTLKMNTPATPSICALLTVHEWRGRPFSPIPFLPSADRIRISGPLTLYVPFLTVAHLFTSEPNTQSPCSQATQVPGREAIKSRNIVVGVLREHPELWEHKKRTLGIGEIAQPGKYLLCNRENLAGSLEIALKSGAEWCRLVLPVPRRWRQEDSQGLLVRHDRQVSGFQIELCSLQMPHVQAWMCTHICAHMRIHAQTHVHTCKEKSKETVTDLDPKVVMSEGFLEEVTAES